MFEKFKQIQKLEVSPFLFTRIEQCIKNRQGQKISTKTAIVALASISLLLLLNLAAINTGKSQQSDNYIPTYSNSLYE